MPLGNKRTVYTKSKHQCAKDIFDLTEQFRFPTLKALIST